MTTQVSPGVLSFAFGALIARQLPVPVLIPTPSTIYSLLPFPPPDKIMKYSPCFFAIGR